RTRRGVDRGHLEPLALQPGAIRAVAGAKVEELPPRDRAQQVDEVAGAPVAQRAHRALGVEEPLPLVGEDVDLARVKRRAAGEEQRRARDFVDGKAARAAVARERGGGFGQRLAAVGAAQPRAARRRHARQSATRLRHPDRGCDFSMWTYGFSRHRDTTLKPPRTTLSRGMKPEAR